MSALKKNQPKDWLEEGKKWYQSRTIIATIVSIVVYTAGQFGYDLSLLWQFFEGDVVETVNQNWNSIVAVISSLVALWGRIVAKVKVVFD